MVGGGLQGLCTAAELARGGVHTALLEQDKPTQRSSWAAGGILSPLYPWREPTALQALIRWNQKHYPGLTDELVRVTGLDPEWQQCGMYIAAMNETEAAQRWAKTHKVRLRYTHDRESFAPLLTADTGGLISLPEVAQLRPPRLLQALRQYLLHLGVVLKEQIRVDRLLLHGQQLEGVHTQDGPWQAKQVVIAAGAWSSRLLPGLNAPIKPIRGQIICYQTKPDYLPHIIVRDGYYAIPRRDGLVLVGSTLEDVGFDNRVTCRVRQELMQAAEQLLPGLEQFKVVHQWSGLRPAGASDQLPFIGAHPEIKGLYLNTGHYRNGILLAPGSARLLVDLMLGKQPIVSSRPFALAGRLDPVVITLTQE